jgi:trimeric autotransporter adhesin
VTSDAGGNLATSTLAGLGLASSADISAINAQLAGINNRLDDLTNRSNRASGVAMALAVTGGYLPESKNFAVAVNYGTFERQNAAALST